VVAQVKKTLIRLDKWKCFATHAKFSNTWRGVGNAKKIFIAIEMLFGRKLAILLASTYPGRCLRGRWSAIWRVLVRVVMFGIDPAALERSKKDAVAGYPYVSPEGIRKLRQVLVEAFGAALEEILHEEQADKQAEDGAGGQPPAGQAGADDDAAGGAGGAGGEAKPKRKSCKRKKKQLEEDIDDSIDAHKQKTGRWLKELMAEVAGTAWWISTLILFRLLSPIQHWENWCQWAAGLREAADRAIAYVELVRPSGDGFLPGKAETILQAMIDLLHDTLGTVHAKLDFHFRKCDVCFELLQNALNIRRHKKH
jgi:hypothetical protein